MAIFLVRGANSLKSLNRLPVNSKDAELMPARLLPEPEKLLNRFCEFPALRKTTGMGVPCVARAAATVAVVEEVTIRSTLSWTSLCAMLRSSSSLPLEL
jgi:hypothetical protein